MRKRIHLNRGRMLLASYSLSRRRGIKRWLVYIPESGAIYHEAQRSEIKSWLGPKLADQYHFLIFNKPGLKPNKTDPVEFEQSFRRQLRIKDIKKMLDKLIPTDHLIDLVGYSEGAYLVPEVANLDHRVQSIVMIGGGTRGWLKEELSNAGPRQRGACFRQIRDIMRHPRSIKIWNGFSYATWHSYREDRTYQNLTRIKAQVLGIVGARDRTIDLKSTIRDFRWLSHRKNLRFKIFKNCGHSFINHWADAWFEVQRFLSPNIIHHDGHSKT
jgi:pimeloyl-ACP methyl ester carboxylesterase